MNIRNFAKIAGVLAVGLLALNPARGESVSFFGNFTLHDADLDGFREQLSFSNPLNSEAGFISVVSTPSDPVLIEAIRLPQLSLDPSSYVSGSHFDFQPGLYDDAFAVSVGGLAWVTADLTAERLNVDGATASINTNFHINLTDIKSTPHYPGGSPFVDKLLGSAGGRSVLTLNDANTDFSQAITPVAAGTSVSNTYSGTAQADSVSTGEPIPTPEAVLMGLVGLGLCVLWRRKQLQG